MQDSAHALPLRDASSLIETLTSHRTGLLKTAARITGCTSRAEDIVQDAYLRASTSHTETMPGNERLNLLFRIVRNLAIDHYRRQTMEQKYMVNDEAQLHAAIQPAGPECITDARQTLGRIDNLLAQLPERTRYAFVMYRVHGKPQKDIAAELGVSPTLVNFMIRDALVHCRKSLGD